MQYCAMQFLADLGANVLVDFGADFFLAYLFILNHDKVISDAFPPGNFVFKLQETILGCFGSKFFGRFLDKFFGHSLGRF